MPKPAIFTPAEISALASWLREVWRQGSQITPWLRDNADRLTKVNREERFSWAVVAAALNEAGIVYRTGNPWTASNLAKAVSEVRLADAGIPRLSKEPNSQPDRGLISQYLSRFFNGYQGKALPKSADCTSLTGFIFCLSH